MSPIAVLCMACVLLAGMDIDALPAGLAAVERLQVDARGHVWLLAGSQLWRMAGPVPPYKYLYLPVIYR